MFSELFKLLFWPMKLLLSILIILFIILLILVFLIARGHISVQVHPSGSEKEETTKPSFYLVHQLKPGETLWHLEKLYNVPSQIIREINQIHNERKLRVGQEILIPENSVRYESSQNSGSTRPELIKEIHQQSATRNRLLYFTRDSN